MDVKNGCGDTGGAQEAGTNWEAGLTYTLPCAKETAGGNLPYNAGSSALWAVTTWRAGMGREAGSGGKGHM